MPYRSLFPEWFASLTDAQRAAVFDSFPGPLPPWMAESLTAAGIPVVPAEIAMGRQAGRACATVAARLPGDGTTQAPPRELHVRQSCPPPNPSE